MLAGLFKFCSTKTQKNPIKEEWMGGLMGLEMAEQQSDRGENMDGWMLC